MTAANTRSIVSALLAVAGIWLLVRHIPEAIASTIVFGLEGIASPVSIVAVHATNFLASAAVGALLIATREKVSAWLAPHEASIEVNASIAVSVGIAILGSYFLAKGFQSIGLHFVNVSNSGTHSLYSGVSSTIIGIALFLASGSIGRLWQLIQQVRRSGV